MKTEDRIAKIIAYAIIAFIVIVLAIAGYKFIVWLIGA